MKNQMSFNQKYEVQLNAETKIIIMKPGQDLFLRYVPKIGKLMQTLFENKDDWTAWTQDPVKYDFVNSVVKPILLYCIRNPEDYRKRLLVDSDQKPSASQEFYDDFNPEMDAKLLKEQGFFQGGETEKIPTPQLTLFFAILRKSGWLDIPEVEAEAETFPDVGDGDKEAADLPVVPAEPVQQETQ